MTRNEYNGWTNYETWLVNLWTDGDDYVTELANDERYEYDFQRGDALKDHVSEFYLQGSDMASDLAADLIKSALSEVNWSEIIESRKDSE